MRTKTMKITLVDKEDHDSLCRIQKENPKLTFNDAGYRYIDSSTLSGSDLAAKDEVAEILKKSILGFVEFNNFTTRSKNQRVKIRFQYD